MGEWKLVCENTYRIPVPGGWLYRYHYDRVFRMVFVPDVDK
jgi:hypothetical protein